MDGFHPLDGISGAAEGEVVPVHCDIHGTTHVARMFGRASCPQCTLNDIEAHAERDAMAHEQAVKDARIASIGLPKRYQKAELSDFQPSERDGAATPFMDAIDRGEHVQAIILGPVGTGKTHFAAALAKEVARIGKASPRYASATGYLRDLRSTYDDPSRRTQSVFDEYARAGVLFLDDIGAGTEYSNDVWRLHELIDYRYCEELPTAYISNLPVHKKAEDNALRGFMGDRAYDRMRENAVLIRMLGETRRRPK